MPSLVSLAPSPFLSLALFLSRCAEWMKQPTKCDPNLALGIILFNANGATGGVGVDTILLSAHKEWTEDNSFSSSDSALTPPERKSLHGLVNALTVGQFKSLVPLLFEHLVSAEDGIYESALFKSVPFQEWLTKNGLRALRHDEVSMRAQRPALQYEKFWKLMRAFTALFIPPKVWELTATVGKVSVAFPSFWKLDSRNKTFLCHLTSVPTCADQVAMMVRLDSLAQTVSSSAPAHSSSGMSVASSSSVQTRLSLDSSVQRPGSGSGSGSTGSTHFLREKTINSMVRASSSFDRPPSFDALNVAHVSWLLVRGVPRGIKLKHGFPRIAPGPASGAHHIEVRFEASDHDIIGADLDAFTAIMSDSQHRRDCNVQAASGDEDQELLDFLAEMGDLDPVAESMSAENLIEMWTSSALRFPISVQLVENVTEVATSIVFKEGMLLLRRVVERALALPPAPALLSAPSRVPNAHMLALMGKRHVAAAPGATASGNVSPSTLLDSVADSNGYTSRGNGDMREGVSSSSSSEATSVATAASPAIESHAIAASGALDADMTSTSATGSTPAGSAAPADSGPRAYVAGAGGSAAVLHAPPLAVFSADAPVPPIAVTIVPPSASLAFNNLGGRIGIPSSGGNAAAIQSTSALTSALAGTDYAAMLRRSPAQPPTQQAAAAAAAKSAPKSKARTKAAAAAGDATAANTTVPQGHADASASGAATAAASPTQTGGARSAEAAASVDAPPPKKVKRTATKQNAVKTCEYKAQRTVTVKPAKKPSYKLHVKRLPQSNGTNLPDIKKLGKGCATGYNCSACLAGWKENGKKALLCSSEWTEMDADGRSVTVKCKRTIHRACFAEANGDTGKWLDYFEQGVPFVCVMCEACAGCGQEFNGANSQACDVCQHSFCERCHDLSAGADEFTCSACCPHVTAAAAGSDVAAMQAEDASD
jgi:hypothetical protein